MAPAVVYLLCIFSIQTVLIETINDEENIGERVWSAMQAHVIDDLDYLASLARSNECKQKLEETYIEHVSYSVIRKDDSYSFDLQNLCPMRSRNAPNISEPIESPSSLRIVYLIVMHQDPLHVIRLITTLNTSRDIFLIHIDKGASPNMTDTISQYATAHDNIHLMQQQKVIWGGFSIIAVQLDAMRYAIQCLKLRFDFLMVLSGSDYPLSSINSIKSFLFKYRGKTLMRKLKALESRHIIPYLQDVYCECDNALYHVGRRQINEDDSITMYISSLFATYHYDFVHYVVHDDDILPDYIDFFAVTAVSDEIFFSTVLMNSPLCHDYAHDLEWSEWRLELWPFLNADKSLIRCKYAHTNTAFCGIGPIDILSQHLPVLQSTKALFARKFNPKKDGYVLDVVDQWIRTKKTPLLPQNGSYSIQIDNQCLTYRNDAHDADLDQCDTMDEMQRFLLRRCTEDVYWNANGCLQSKRQYGDKAWSICEIRNSIDECLSVLSSSAGVHEGIEIVMNECVDNGVSQKFYFNECRVQYAHPLLMYLQESDQSLCIGLCHRTVPCLRSCNTTDGLMMIGTHLSKQD
eukprot:270443_1